MYLIETNSLCKKYSGKLVIDHVNMHIPEGSIYGFVGENGSGKTTIMRLLTGLATPNEGLYSLFGVDFKDPKIYEARKEIAAIVENVSYVPSMTALDNVIYQEKYLGLKLTPEERQELLAMVHLENVGKKKVKNFSLGMRQRLGIALSMIKKPKLMFLDEPMNGLDPQGIVELRDLLIELNQKHGLTVLISSHILSELEKIASCYGFISHGQLVEEISVEELLARCEKSLVVKVEDVAHAEEVIKEMGVQKYKAFPNGDISIYDEIDIGETVSYLNKKKVKILSIKSVDESVEDYYLRLIRKGAK